MVISYQKITSILIVFFLSFTTLQSSDSEKYGLSKYSILQFELVNGLLLLDLELNNESGTYIFDTGLDGIIINGAVNKSDQIFETLGGPIETEEIKLNHFKIGNLILTDQTAYRANLNSISKFIGKSIDGMIGMAVLDGMLISINYKNQSLKLFPKIKSLNQITKGKNKLDIIFQNDIPCIQFKNESQDLLFALDTGAGIHIIDKNITNDSNPTISKVNLVTISSLKDSRLETTFDLKDNNGAFFSLKFMLSDLSSINKHLDLPINGVISAKEMFKGQFLIDTKLGLLYY